MKTLPLKEIFSSANWNNSDKWSTYYEPLNILQRLFSTCCPDVYRWSISNLDKFMEAALTIIRYKKRFIFFAFQTMLIFRIPLLLNKNISFFKLLGTSRKGRFLMKPDWQQWGIITVRNKAFEGNKCKTKQLNDPGNYLLIREIYGPFIAAWFRLFNCETFTANSNC